MPVAPASTTRGTSRRATLRLPSSRSTIAAIARPAIVKRRPEKASGFQRSNAYFVVA